MVYFQNHSLFIDLVEASDAGTYQCWRFNSSLYSYGLTVLDGRKEAGVCLMLTCSLWSQVLYLAKDGMEWRDARGALRPHQDGGYTIIQHLQASQLMICQRGLAVAPGPVRCVLKQPVAMEYLFEVTESDIASLGGAGPVTSLCGSVPVTSLGRSGPVTSLGGSGPLTSLGGSGPVTSLGGAGPGDLAGNWDLLKIFLAALAGIELGIILSLLAAILNQTRTRTGSPDPLTMDVAKAPPGGSSMKRKPSGPGAFPPAGQSGSLSPEPQSGFFSTGPYQEPATDMTSGSESGLYENMLPQRLQLSLTGQPFATRSCDRDSNIYVSA